MKKIEKVFKICESWNNGKIPTLEELKTVAYTDLMPLYENEDYETRIFIEDTFKEVLKKYGKYWDDFDENYPNNPYYIGYELHGEIFITAYTGVGGRYWNNNDYETLCRI